MKKSVFELSIKLAIQWGMKGNQTMSLYLNPNRVYPEAEKKLIL